VYKLSFGIGTYSKYAVDIEWFLKLGKPRTVCLQGSNDLVRPCLGPMLIFLYCIKLTFLLYCVTGFWFVLNKLSSHSLCICRCLDDMIIVILHHRSRYIWRYEQDETATDKTAQNLTSGRKIIQTGQVGVFAPS